MEAEKSAEHKANIFCSPRKFVRNTSYEFFETCEQAGKVGGFAWKLRGVMNAKAQFDCDLTSKVLND